MCSGTDGTRQNDSVSDRRRMADKQEPKAWTDAFETPLVTGDDGKELKFIFASKKARHSAVQTVKSAGLGIGYGAAIGGSIYFGPGVLLGAYAVIGGAIGETLRKNTITYTFRRSKDVNGKPRILVKLEKSIRKPQYAILKMIGAPDSLPKTKPETKINKTNTGTETESKNKLNPKTRVKFKLENLEKRKWWQGKGRVCDRWIHYLLDVSPKKQDKNVLSGAEGFALLLREIWNIQNSGKKVNLKMKNPIKCEKDFEEHKDKSWLNPSRWWAKASSHMRTNNSNMICFGYGEIKLKQYLKKFGLPSKKPSRRKSGSRKRKRSIRLQTLDLETILPTKKTNELITIRD